MSGRDDPAQQNAVPPEVTGIPAPPSGPPTTTPPVWPDQTTEPVDLRGGPTVAAPGPLIAAEPTGAPGVPVTPVTPVRKHSRAGAAWVALVVAAVVMIFLLIFIVQNSEPVQVRYFGFEGTLSLGVAMLFAAIAGALTAGLLGTVRILQLRARARRASTPP